MAQINVVMEVNYIVLFYCGFVSDYESRLVGGKIAAFESVFGVKKLREFFSSCGVFFSS